MNETVAETTERKAAFWKRSKVCNYIGSALGIVLVAPVLLLLFDRREPVTLYSGTIEPGVVYSSQATTVTWKATENIADCDGELERRVVDKAGKIHSFKREPTVYHMKKTVPKQICTGADGKPVGCDEFTKPFEMPEGMVDGDAYYQTNGRRWCNVLQQYIWPIPFEGPKVWFKVDNKLKSPVIAPSLVPEIIKQLEAKEVQLPTPKPRPRKRAPQRRQP